MSVKNDVVRYCHSDVQLHMSWNTLSQLSHLVSLSVKFARLIEGEGTYEFNSAIHWQTQLENLYSDYAECHKVDKPLVSVLHTYFD